MQFFFCSHHEPTGLSTFTVVRNILMQPFTVGGLCLALTLKDILKKNTNFKIELTYPGSDCTCPTG